MKGVFEFVGCCLVFCLPGWAGPCEDLANLPLPHAKVTGAAVVRDQESLAHVSPEIGDVPPFCRVSVLVTPAPDSEIRVEVWMPVDGWNGKFEGTGSGGFAGSIQRWGLADGVRRGYAVANTDMGTAPSTSENGDALIGHPEKWTDWGARATHEMTVVAKSIVRAYYHRPPQLAYFNGCSTGGEQGLMEAQRYPEDYDGIVSGAPANNRTHLHMAILWNFVMSEGPPETRIPASKLPMLEKAVLNACSAQKAVPADAFLSQDPAACHWDPQVLTCKTGDAPDCLTPQQVGTAKKIYAGPTNPVTHASIYPGVEPGSESGWSSFVPRDGNAPYGGIFRWVFGPQWKWQSFDFNRDVATMDARLAPILNATDPDLSSFKAKGHKLILYHGWADWLVPPRESLLYYDSVVHANTQNAAAAPRNELDETRAYFRLYMVPGMAHCGGGPGLNEVEALIPLEQWVEHGVAPESLKAWRDDHGTTRITRPVCAYPDVAHYDGKGDPSDRASFVCAPAETGWF